MRILFVHGIAQGGRDPVELERIWTESLKEKWPGPWPAELRVDFPYYGDLLDGFVARNGLPSAGDVVAKGAGQDRAFEEFMRSALGEMKAKAKISDATVRKRLEPGEEAEAKGFQNWRFVRATARTIDELFPRVTRFGIEHFLKEVFVYVERPAARRAVDAEVERLLTGEPTIVVGHSLGTVVAYNVVKQNRRAIDLRRFVTVGSPLGLSVVTARLGEIENVASKVGWYNAYDPQDIVAMRPLEKPWFEVAPKIDNDPTVVNTTDNEHGIVSYLNHVKLADIVAKAVAGTPA